MSAIDNFVAGERGSYIFSRTNRCNDISIIVSTFLTAIMIVLCVPRRHYYATPKLNQQSNERSRKTNRHYGIVKPI